VIVLRHLLQIATLSWACIVHDHGGRPFRFAGRAGDVPPLLGCCLSRGIAIDAIAAPMRRVRMP